MPNTTKPSLITLIVLTAFASVAGILYTPAIPAIIKDFGINANSVQLTMSIFLIGYTVGQLFFGPITHRFGRKSTIYLGIAIAILGSLLCILGAQKVSFSLFLWGRFFQALGTSVGLVIAFAMINDVYEGAPARRIISFATLAFAILPGIATLVGGMLVEYFTWVSCFYFLTLYSFFVLALSIKLPETSPHKDPNALKLSAITQRYRSAVATNPYLLPYACLWGLSTAIIYIFAAIAPLLSINYLHASADVFGRLNLITSMGLVVGNMLSARAATQISARKTIACGIFLTFTGCITLSLLEIAQLINLWTLFIPMFFVYLGLPLIFSNASALAAKQATDKATASSVITTTNMSFAVLGSLFVSQLPEPFIIHHLAEIFLGIAGLMVLLFAATGKLERAVEA